VRGDRLFAIRTLSVRVGARRILELSTSVLAATLVGAGCLCLWGAAGAAAAPALLRGGQGVVGAAALATAVFVRSSCAGLLRAVPDEESDEFRSKVSLPPPPAARRPRTTHRAPRPPRPPPAARRPPPAARRPPPAARVCGRGR
jgi:hypothetical protein